MVLTQEARSRVPDLSSSPAPTPILGVAALQAAVAQGFISFTPSQTLVETAAPTDDVLRDRLRAGRSTSTPRMVLTLSTSGVQMQNTQDEA
jgi:alkanesulfonate monooxygenase SsuD/methylene tetrahydromethanopterin reductase-like flavin-dependent oxidoreductase (luciferase family)